MDSGGRKKSKSKSRRHNSSRVESGTDYAAAKGAGVSGMLDGTPGYLITGFSAVELIIGIVYIAMGAANLDKCKLEPMIPIWLILMGVTLVITAVHEYFHYYRRSKKVGHGRGMAALIVTGALVLLLVALFIAGNVFVYTAYAAPPDFGHHWFRNGCDHAVFNLAFVSIIIMDALMGLLILAILFFAMYQLFSGN